MKKYTVKDIKSVIKNFQIVGNDKNYWFDNYLPISEADEFSLVWLKPNTKDEDELIKKTKAKIIICGRETKIPSDILEEKLFIVVENPKLSFLRILNFLNQTKIEWGTHPYALIHPDAQIHQNTYIGPYTYIGKSIIGENTIIHGHNFIHDDVEIGKNVVIHANTVIGSDGFGFLRNEKGELEKFPHIGKVVIEDNVEIYPFVNVDRGALFETRIKRGSKIDHYCHIGHNSLVCENTLITAGTVLCGGSQVGERTWIGVGTIIKEKIKVGNDVMIGLGTVVTKDVPDNETWIGMPARPFEQFVKLQKEFKKLIK